MDVEFTYIGRMISISGHYGLTDEAARRVGEWLKSGAVELSAC